MLVYCVSKNLVELADRKTRTTKKFQGYGEVTKEVKGGKTYIKHVDLLAAPMEFLLENNFKEKEHGQKNVDNKPKSRTVVSRTNKSRTRKS